MHSMPTVNTSNSFVLISVLINIFSHHRFCVKQIQVCNRNLLLAMHQEILCLKLLVIINEKKLEIQYT